MTIDAWIAIGSWAIFTLIYLPWQIVRHRKRIRAISAIRKGVFLMRKYKALKELNNGVYRPTRSSGRSALVENQN
ncbi:hypothetical protein KKJ06_22720 [Xenorhabdus bovienii]|uniref:hypothetical protein n=1 Tax=Xenorhabdus bovienii TaxID=40576 RepID=UPI00237CF389|nr:hypothetical protein [Xenorhabdus bovienii]MDE1488595.1 hypothetical protein [Xenorhabdus bovienii]MDE9443981.1 hypothetical protein [Xenorhabdus bovienii]MDE9479596.1 hypothetical protein [Xenorhabdus bovienii]MDE9532331.1 hypothetical protein [Xenorhabdus bovienii]MDE9549517.1 hypothetical protein [Xenorhabdus bovienii]